MCRFIGIRGSPCRKAPTLDYCKQHNRNMVDVLQIENYALREENAKLKTVHNIDEEVERLREANECLEVDIKIIQDKYDHLMDQLNAFGAGFKKI